MNIIELLALVVKIQREAPILLPDAMKVLNDVNQTVIDFQKLMADLQRATGQPNPTVLP